MSTKPRSAAARLHRLKTGKEIIESPEFKRRMVAFRYLAASSFTPISVNNFGSYVALDNRDGFTYAVHPAHSAGFVFSNDDIAQPPVLGLIPVMVVRLSDSSLEKHKRTYQMRVRRGFARQGLPITWCVSYVVAEGRGLVVDPNCLGGGRPGWRAFLRLVTERNLKIFVADTRTGKRVPANTHALASATWWSAQGRALLLDKS